MQIGDCNFPKHFSIDALKSSVINAENCHGISEQWSKLKAEILESKINFLWLLTLL